MPIPIIKTDEYVYSLPQHRIAQYPLKERDESKLAIYKKGVCQSDYYNNIASYLPEDSLIIFNNSKVIAARILYIKDTSGIIELFCLEPKTGTPYEALQQQGKSIWTCLIGGLKKWKKDFILQWQLLSDPFCIVSAHYIKQTKEGHEIEFTWNHNDLTFASILEALGQMPIPPYLLRKAELQDQDRYQTTYATVSGSVAAPTAGLHFTDSIMQDLRAKKISISFSTLHVGAGTFKPVTAEFAHEHHMHAEWLEVDRAFINQLAKYDSITCVGTTSLRTVESLYWIGLQCIKTKTLPGSDYILPQFLAYETEETPNKKIVFQALSDMMNEKGVQSIICKTELMILPGYQLQVASQLITNFHQPGSTLLMLVDCFVNGEWKSIYQYAIENEFRFLSYGDGCLLFRK